MIWTELEACKRQVSQVGVSACGATAVINVLQGLEFEDHNVSQVIDVVPPKLRAEDAPVATYLFSRSVAGTTHTGLIDAVHKITRGRVYGRFFHMFPRRKFKLLPWLSDWIRKGAVPLATLNRQRGEVRVGQTIPDAWHHQMIFGVGPNGVYLTNPLESVTPEALKDQLCSPSELLVRRNDVIMRWQLSESATVTSSKSTLESGVTSLECSESNNDLHLIHEHEDERWETFNVLGQVVNVIREESCRKPTAAVAAAAAAGGDQQQLSQQQQQSSSSSKRQLKQHIRIPAAYKS